MKVRSMGRGLAAGELARSPTDAGLSVFAIGEAWTADGGVATGGALICAGSGRPPAATVKPTSSPASATSPA